VRALAGAVAARYRGRFPQGFVRGKLRGDPVLPALLALPPLGQVLDLGCGRGQLAIALLLGGRADGVEGLDLDAGKIAHARAAAQGLAARFAAADIASAALPAADTVLLVDVLYQLGDAAQDAVLARAAACARRRVLIRALDPDVGWRSGLGRGVEVVRRALGADLGRRRAIRPRAVAALAAPLRDAGFVVDVLPCRAGTPLPNVLVVAQRP
jgi:SAM-dependent methyltransferase